MSGKSADGPDSADVPSLQVTHEEARRTLDAQLSTLDDIDAKALSVFRLNVGLVGVLLSALSFAAASDVATVSAVLNVAVGLGVGSFLLSAAAAGLTYATAGQRIGADPGGLEDAIELSEPDALVWLVESYAEWIRHNQRTNLRKAFLVNLSILGTVAGTLALGVGAIAAFTGLVYPPLAIAVVALVVLVFVTDLHGQIYRLSREADVVSGTLSAHALESVESVESCMEGQQAFRGRDSDD